MAAIHEEITSIRQSLGLIEGDTTRQAASHLIALAETVLRGAPLKSEFLHQFKVAMSSDQLVVYASNIANLLAKHHPAARDLIWELAQEGNEQARFGAVSAATWRTNLPLDFVAKVLRVGLRDPVRRNRMHALGQASELRIRDLMPDMVQLRQMQTDPDEAEIIDEYISLTRDGYVATPLPRQERPGILLKVYVDRLLTGAWIRQEDFCTRSVAVIAQEIAERFRKGRLQQNHDCRDEHPT